MKINLLREDQMTKVPHQDKEKEILRFDDTFSGGNDDFYFQQPAPPSEEYKRPRRSRIWLFILVLLVFLIGGAFISNPDGTKDFFAHFGKNVTRLWHRGVDKVQRVWLHRNDKDVVYITETPAPAKTPVKEAAVTKDISGTAAKPAEQQIIRVEKPIEKQIIKEKLEEKIVESPPVFDRIRDDLALSKRNIYATEFVWSRIPGGMTLDKLVVREDSMSIVVSSRHAMLIQSYSNVIEQNDMFSSITAGEAETVGEQTRIRLTSDLPPLKREDRPERIWDLDVEWFDDYLTLAANNAEVIVTQEILGSETLDDMILKHQIHVSVSGDRTSMMVFFQELQDIPAACVVREVASSYYPEDQSNLLELDLVYYERK